MRTQQSGKSATWLLLALLLVLLIGGGLYLLQSGDPAGPVDDSPAVLARERASAYFDDELYNDARLALAPLVQIESPAPEDLLRAANIELAAFEFELASELLARAQKLTPDDPAVAWSLYRIARDEGDFAGALEHVRRAHELAPGDFPTKLALANTLNELTFDEPELFDEADALYRELLSRGKEYSGSWYLTTTYRYSRLLSFADRQDDAMQYLNEYQQLAATGLTVPQQNDLDRGTFGKIATPPVGALAAGPRGVDSPLATGLGDLLGTRLDLPGIRGVRSFQLRDDADSNDTDTLVQRVPSSPERALVFGESGIHLVRFENGALSLEVVSGRAATDARMLDLDAEERAFGEPIGPTEILSFDGARVVLFELRDTAWQERTLLELPGAISALAPVDFDHEGDLDLVVVGNFGARLLRNDGAGSTKGSFVDASEMALLPTGGALTWVSVEDLDSDQDVDLFFGSASSAFWHDNERGGEFRDRTADLPSSVRDGGQPWIADFDGDGVVDIASGAAPSQPSELWYGDGFGGFKLAQHPLPATSERVLEQTPLIETQRIVGTSAGQLLSVRMNGTDRDAPFAEQPLDAGTAQHFGFADLDGDRRQELLIADSNGLQAIQRKQPGNSLRLWLAGEKDNRRGVGAIVELRQGPAYRRWFWTGEPQTIDVAGATTVDLLRVNWPNGVTQTLVDVPTGQDLRVRQKEGLIGSCPFLYTWNGTKFEFISDVIGITPLGLPMAPGMLVPPDHDEYVLVRGDQLAPKDGEYLLQFTEELREVTYLDQVRLDVIDHPSHIEVFPNERFTFPPFPEAHTHSVDGALSAQRVSGSDGKDWTEQLAANDSAFAIPFERLTGQFLGLATPHFLEFEFDANATNEAELLRLVMTGWFYWTDASVNMASAGHPGADFIPPLLQVPDKSVAGGWRTIEPPLGFPAGKLKTMVIDVTQHLDRTDPRFRIFSSLRLYWDSIRLAVCDDSATLVTTSIEPHAAELWSRGFSAPSTEYNELGLEWFEWDELDSESRWNQHPGLYTKFGECVTLLDEVDDRYVIMGSGDCLTLRFDAASAPPLPEGWSRDFLLYLDGWAKDRDPNSHEALFVEPLPFHGMSGYPYRADESFPDDVEHKEWRREWNTRPAKNWIPSIRPAHANR